MRNSLQANRAHARIREHQACGLDLDVPSRDLRDVRRGVVLHLLAGVEVILTDRLDGLVSDRVTATERGQCLIGERRAGGDQLFVHANHVAFAAGVQPHDLFAMFVGQLGALHAGHFGAPGAKHLLHRTARDP